MTRLGAPRRAVAAPLPEFAATGALLLPLDAVAMEPPSAPRVRVGGLWLRRKDEFHVTLLSRALGPRLRALLDEPALQVTLAALDWRVQRLHAYDFLGKLKPAPHGAVACYSVIEHVHVPGMQDLYAAIAERIPDFPACPPPHVTHYVVGDRQGIGVPDEAALAAYRIRPVQEAELA
ncbi:MAG: hypothetical protein HOQ02_03745 [Lysobacter sp.]|nr:hypothetical protein [Lysobacter sp.]